VVEATFYERVQRLFARVTPRAMPAVVSERDGFGESHVETEWSRYPRRDLGDFQRVGETRAHVIIGKNENLGLAGEAAKGARVQDPVSVAFEAGTKLVGSFFAFASTAAVTTRGARDHQLVELLLSGGQGARESRVAGSGFSDSGSRITVGDGDVIAGSLVALHGRGPPSGAFGDGFNAHVIHHASAP
jgi:hypothetical protein